MPLKRSVWVGDPVGHVAAERAAHRRGARRVDVGPLFDGVGDGHQVGVRRRAPRSPSAGDERPAVTGRQAPDRAAAPHSRRRPSATGSTATTTRSTSPTDRRGSTAPAAQVTPRSRHRAARASLAPSCRRSAVVDTSVSEPGSGGAGAGPRSIIGCWSAPEEAMRAGAGGGIDCRPHRVDPPAVWVDADARVGPAVGGQPRHRAIEVDSEQRRAAVGVGDHDECGAIGQPHGLTRPAVPIGSDRSARWTRTCRRRPGRRSPGAHRAARSRSTSSPTTNARRDPSGETAGRQVLDVGVVRAARRAGQRRCRWQ